MTDKEVGEFWRKLNIPGWSYPDKKELLAVFHKLVEERTSKIAFARRINLYEARPIALKEFGIPEETWPNGIWRRIDL